MSEVNTTVVTPADRPMELKSAGCALAAALEGQHPVVFLLIFAPAAKSHQGMTFLRPFFFLLVDSFLLLPLAPFCVPSCAVEPSVLGVSEA